MRNFFDQETSPWNFEDPLLQDRVHLGSGSTIRLECVIDGFQAHDVRRRDLCPRFRVAGCGVDVALRWQFCIDRQCDFVAGLGRSRASMSP